MSQIVFLLFQNKKYFSAVVEFVPKDLSFAIATQRERKNVTATFLLID